jgi:hypothetical protein
MVTLINPPSKLHYLRNVRSPALLGCADCPAKYHLKNHPALRGLGQVAALGDSGVPAGTILSYSAQWGNNFSSWNDPNAIQSVVQSVLAQKWGVIVQSQFHNTSDVLNLSGKSGFVLQVAVNRDYGAAGDVKSVIDGELYNAGVLGLTSTIAVTQQVASPTSTISLPQAQANLAQAQASGDPAAIAQWAAVVQQLQAGGATPTRDPLTWLSSNWGWVAAAVVGVFVAREAL